MSSLQIGQIVIFQKYRGDLIFCKLITDEPPFFLQDLRYPDAKPHRTIVENKISGIPKVVFETYNKG